MYMQSCMYMYCCYRNLHTANLDPNTKAPKGLFGLKEGNDPKDTYDGTWDPKEGSDEGSDEGSTSEDERQQVPIDQKQEWDCESILSTYSNLYNHPTLIKDTPTSKHDKPIKVDINSYLIAFFRTFLYLYKCTLVYMYKYTLVYKYTKVFDSMSGPVLCSIFYDMHIKSSVIVVFLCSLINLGSAIIEIYNYSIYNLHY